MENPVLWLLLIVGASCQSTCPKDVFTKVQMCLIDTDIFSLGNTFKDRYTDMMDYCTVSLQGIYDCVTRYKSLCMINQNETIFLDLLVNETRVLTEMQKFCTVLPELVQNTTCSDGISNSSRCVYKVVGNFDREVRGGKDLSRRDIFDLSCVMFIDMTACFLAEFPATDNCKRSKDVYRGIFAALQYPYCTLKDAERDKLFPQIVPPTVDAATNLMMSYSAFFTVSFLLLLTDAGLSGHTHA